MAASICLVYALTRAALPCALNLFQLHMLDVCVILHGCCLLRAGNGGCVKKVENSSVAFKRSFRFRALPTNLEIVSMLVLYSIVGIL